MIPQFDFSRLEAYDLAAEFVLWTEAQRHSLRRRPHLAHQLHRAATSVALNIAEGAGEFRPREKARFYRMARRSATECAGVVDLLARIGTVEAEQAQRGEVLLAQILPLLITMCRNQERKASRVPGTAATK